MDKKQLRELKKSLKNFGTGETSQPEPKNSLGTNILLSVIIGAIVAIWLPFLSIAVGWKVLLTIGVLAGAGSLLPNQDGNYGSSEKDERKTLVVTIEKGQVCL